MELSSYMVTGFAFLFAVLVSLTRAMCGEEQFECVNGFGFKCIALKLRCNGIDECSDGSDEMKCFEYKCPREQRKYKRGTITSPSYPHLNATPSCGFWSIDSPSTKDYITVSVSGLDIPSTSDACDTSMDFLAIGHHRICNHPVTPAVYFFQGRVDILYKFSGKIPARGFELQYIRGPMYHGNICMLDETQCRNGKCIFSKWLCNGAAECEDFSDEENCPAFSTSTTPSTTSDLTDCGPDEFSCHSVKSHSLHCFPNTNLCDGFRQCMDGYDERQGCHMIQMNNTCGHTYGGYHGVIQSPNFPNHYPGNLDCVTFIRVVSGNTIQLRFITFLLEEMAYTDVIKVYNGVDESSEILGVFSMESPPPSVVESTGSQMMVLFHTDDAGSSVGFNATFQVKGVCLPSQRQCLHGDKDCFEPSQRCDGNWDCLLHGGDERGCEPCTSSKDMFLCGTMDSKGGGQCFRESDRCNGKGHCPNRKDEVNCLPSQCGAHNGTFLCLNRQCVLENWVCDGANDCGDNSDEIGCPLSTKVIIAAVIGSLTCSLLLVVALGCTCKLHTLRFREQSGLGSPSYISPLTQVQDEIFARRAAPPPYLEAMRISRNFDEVQREVLSARQVALETTQTSDRQTQAALSSDDDELIDISMEQSEPPNTREAEGELSDVQISVAMGITAQWRRNRTRIAPKPGEEVTSIADDPGDTASGSNELIIISDLNHKDGQVDRRESLDSIVSDVRNMETIVPPPDPVIHMDSDLESIPPDDVPLLDHMAGDSLL